MTTKTKKAKTLMIYTMVLTLALTVMVAILGTVPVHAMSISGTGNFTVPVGETATVDGDVTGNITVNGGTLILDDDWTITGTVTVQNGGIFNMSDGTITGAGTRGVHVTGIGSTFNMLGGEISGNTLPFNWGVAGRGIGVLVENSATFYMNNTALIYGNTGSSTGGGVSVDTFATFVMAGGRIEGNHAIAHGGGVAVQTNATFEMSGNARIYNNTSGSNDVSGEGAGVWVNSEIVGAASTFIMRGGIIEYNRVPSGLGGGIVATRNGAITIHPGSIIRNNTANHGAGVFVGTNANLRRPGEQATLTMLGGHIYNNIATQAGGGIHMFPYTTANISAGTIQGNTAGTNGGGVFAAAITSMFTMADGTITGNTAGGYGGGIWTANYNNLHISPTVTFSGNSANAPHDLGIVYRGVSVLVPAENSGGGQGGNPHNALWYSVSLPGTHALNNYDINFSSTVVDTPQISIRKKVRMPAGATLPIDPFSFEFDVTLVSITPTPPALTPTVNIPNPTVVFNPGMTLNPVSDGSGDVYAVVYALIDLSGITWTMPGVYRFRVTEMQNSGFASNPDYAIIYDTSVFYLYIYVGRQSGDMTDPLEVIRYYARHRVPTGACDDCEDDEYCETCDYAIIKDPVLMPFKNRLSRRPSTTSFEVIKEVTGRMGDTNLPFDFEVELLLPTLTSFPLSNAIEATITGYARGVDGHITLPPTRVTVSSAIPISVDPITRLATHTFELRHGDVITFTNVPVGTTYVVTEDFVVGYDQSGVATEGGVAGSSVTTTGDDDLIIEGTVSLPINETTVTNYVTVTNTHDGTPPMGVLLSNMPFGLMVALGVGALGLTATAVIVSSKAKSKK